MSLSKKAIDEFKEIYEKEFGEKISDAQAREMGENLINLFRIIYRFLPEPGTEDKRSKNTKTDK